MTTTALPGERGELKLALVVQPLEREVGRGRPVAAVRLGSERAPLVGEKRPREQDEQERDEADGHALANEPGSSRHRYFAMMKTGVPISTWRNSHSASGMRIRMQPCEAE